MHARAIYMCQLVPEKSQHLTNVLSMVGLRRILWDARSYVAFHLSSPLQQDNTTYGNFKEYSGTASKAVVIPIMPWLTMTESGSCAYALRRLFSRRPPCASFSHIGLADLHVSLAIPSRVLVFPGCIPCMKAQLLTAANLGSTLLEATH